MISGSEASRARFLYSETWLPGHASPLIKSIWHDFWLWGLKPQISLFRDVAQGINLPLTKSIRIDVFWLSGLKGLFWDVAPRTCAFPLQSLSELMISGSQASRARFLYSETWLPGHTFSLYKVYPNWWFVAQASNAYGAKLSLVFFRESGLRPLLF